MKCGQKKCAEDAVVSYVWPGKPERLYVCERHMRHASGIAAAIGCPLGDVRIEAATTEEPA